MAEHAVTRKTYLIIFGCLLLLTYVTTQIAFFNLGRLNAIAAIVIAGVKALLVALFFMHVRQSTRLTWTVIVGGLFWLGILFGLTLTDYLSRGWVGRVSAG